MALILTTCPRTGEKVRTGQHVELGEWSSRQDLGGCFRCGACGQVHAWTQAQAYLAPWPGATSAN